MLCDCVRNAAPLRACHGAGEIHLANWEEGTAAGPSADEIAKELTFIEPTRTLLAAQVADVVLEHAEQGGVRHLSHSTTTHYALH